MADTSQPQLQALINYVRRAAACRELRLTRIFHGRVISGIRRALTPERPHSDRDFTTRADAYM